MSARLMGPYSGGPAALRAALAADGPLLLPGCYDALGARLIELAWFDAAYMTGFGTSAGLLGRPDVGLLGMTDMVDNARRIVQATTLPVVADADTGYGNPLNVMHTVRAFEQAGVAGIHLEDQVAPKRCGHMDGKVVVPLNEMVAKIEAAVLARQNDDFVLIARTDARSTLGLDAAIDRAKACRDAGADVLFVEAPQDLDEVARVANELAGTPLLFNWVEGGKTPPLDFATINDLGFAIILMPITTLLAASKAMTAVLEHIKASGSPVGTSGLTTTFDRFTHDVGLADVQTLDTRFR
ncbi:MAG: isocitrate lyase/PEP mutase family protein [Acidimicrobiales bacterium]